jgi:ABC-type Fe3+ transport system substrate-binding protein
MKLPKLFLLRHACAAVLLLACAPVTEVSAATAGREELLNRLVDGARKEKELVIWGVGTMGEDGRKAIENALNARFGTNLRMKYTGGGGAAARFSEAIMETQMGLPSSYDVMYAPDDNLKIIEQGGVERIDSWEAMLPQGVNPKFASPIGVSGQAFLWATRPKVIIYNTNLISASELPATTKDLALPKYKGKFYTAPWLTAVAFGILVHPKEVWLDIMKGWGQNKVTTIHSTGGVQRMMLGEFAFEPLSTESSYFQHRAKGDPAGMSVFKDIVPLSSVFHVVRKAARHPNAAKLFSLWATGPEASQIFEKYLWTGNSHLKESKLGTTVIAEIEKMGAKPVSWFDSKETLEKLKWYSTKEGEAYEREISLALKLK